MRRREAALSANTETAATEKVALDEEQIDRLLADHYGLSDVSQLALGGELDQNVKISTKDDRHFLLKVASGSIDKNNLLWQNELLAHLVDRAPNVFAPRIVAATNGDEVIAWSVDGKTFIARLFWWLEGENIGDIACHSPELLTELGHTAGFVVAALATMPAPSEPISHDWDMMRARSIIDEGIDSLSDVEHRADVEEIMSWYDDVSSVLSSLPTQVIHQDLNDANVLVQIAEDGRQRISGVIDVNDALHTIRVAEIAVCGLCDVAKTRSPKGGDRCHRGLRLRGALDGRGVERRLPTRRDKALHERDHLDPEDQPVRLSLRARSHEGHVARHSPRSSD